MTERMEFACSLTPQGIAERTPQFRALAGQREQHAWQGSRRVLLSFPEGARALVEAFVADESACCGFFDFEVTTDADTVRLGIAAPPGAEELLEDLVAERSR